MKRSDRDPRPLLDSAKAGNRHAIGRLLSLAEAGGDPADALADLTHAAGGNAHIIGITGPPGAGKSTLVGRLSAHCAELGKSPAVLAVDPSSPLTGGAILGDRIRIDSGDANTFVRSIATRGHSGGLAQAVPGALRVLDAVGFDPIMIETVGVGQVEVDITATADTTVVVANPGTGDAVQANKAGLLEVADIFVVNKADHPGADEARRDLSLMLDLSHMTGAEDPTGRRPPIIMVNSLTGDGIDELWNEIAAHLGHLAEHDQLADQRRRRDQAEVRSRVESELATKAWEALDGDTGQETLRLVADRVVTPAQASQDIIKHIIG